MFNPIVLLIIPLIFNQRSINNQMYAVNKKININKSTDKYREHNKTNKTKNLEEERVSQELNNFKSIDLEERKKVIEDILPYLTGHDKNALLKLQDMFDIVYKVNRIKDNDYSNKDFNYLNDIPVLRRSERIVNQVLNNISKTNNNDADKIIELLNGINSAKNNLSYIKRKGVNNPNALIESLKPLIGGEGNSFEKIKKMLRFLNEED